MNIKKNLKKIVATAMLCASATSLKTNADLLDKLSFLGGIMSMGELVPRLLYNKSGVQWAMDRIGYRDGFLNRNMPAAPNAQNN